MPVNEVIRQRRKYLELTQEQVASSLGVSVPAVSKWESGTSYPDVTILPALARLLRTDLNTLLCYEQEMSEKEINTFLPQITAIAEKEGFFQAFLQVKKKIQEYPADYRLIHSCAMVLQGTMMMTELSQKEKEHYMQEIHEMYEIVGKGENDRYAGQANYMLAAEAINADDLEMAQKYIDKIPVYNTLDKRMLQANLWMKKEKTTEAAKVYENKILSALNEVQMPLTQLIHIAVQEQDIGHAEELVNCGKELVKLFGLWNYNAYVFELEKALNEKNQDETLRIMKAIFKEMVIPWNMSISPVTAHMEKRAEPNIGRKMLGPILAELRIGAKYDFLSEEAVQELVKEGEKILDRLGANQQKA